MSYFREYMMSVCAIMIITSVASEILVDFAWSKYINLICGVLFVLCLISPVSGLLNADFNIHLSDYSEEISDTDYISENVKKEFLHSLRAKIKNDVKQKFGITIDIEVSLVDDKIYILLDNTTKKSIIKYIREEYRPDVIKTVGA